MPPAQVLGDHVDQKGSIVQPERLRFDFSHSGPIDGPTLGRIEGICSEQLAQDLPIYAQEVALAEARQIHGAHALLLSVHGACELFYSVNVAACMLFAVPRHRAVERR